MSMYNQLDAKQAIDEMTHWQRQQFYQLMELAFGPNSEISIAPPPTAMFIIGILEGIESGKIVCQDEGAKAVLITTLGLLVKYCPDIVSEQPPENDPFFSVHDKPKGELN